MFAVMIILPFVSAVPARAGQVTHEETVRRTIELAGERTIIIESKSGDIIVVGEPGREDVYFEAIKKVQAQNKEEAERLAALLEVEVKRDGDEIKIVTKYPRDETARKSIISYIMKRYPKMDITLHVTIPERLDVEMKTASGDLRASDMLGAVAMTSASGDLTAVDINGDVQMAASSGDIEVETIGGGAILASASGDITARDVAGDVQIETASGDISIADIGKDLQIETVSGDVTGESVGAILFRGVNGSAEFSDVRGDVTAASASGDLSFRVIPPRDARYKVSASSGDIDLRFLVIMQDGYILKAGTTTGEISASLPIRLTTVGRNKIAGIVRDGKGMVVLETASGDISIVEPEE
jgi:DUF4097 and DUF4098 domain-containing protein YvlB